MSYAEANRRYFDAISDSYDSKPWFKVVNDRVATTLRSDLSWVGIPFTDSTTQPVRLLDYACGTGLMTRVFGPYVTSTQGIDISPNMVTTYNTRARDAGLSEDVVSAVVGDLFNKSDPNPKALGGEGFWDFDIATVGFGFHHFEDVVFAARQLKERLRPGGVLVINDFLEGGDLLAGEDGGMIEGSEGNHAVHGHGHHHHGRNEEKDSGASGHGHHHGHHHHHDAEKKHDVGESNPEFRQKMNASIVVPHFTIDGVKQFFTEAGFVDVDVITMKEKNYMEFGGKKLWRTILFARGRRPMEGQDGSGKSEL
ncbi:S-adenosyl-L-methionine-dependent methyltransferase [Alternaria rosae]|uniref:S-adenosyl-L-methionine-dependent methyltransferase n=1 Tax=Alternaria rosae TaxID=1187941 RepID=UPI001E8E016C|nr:S-adenosyl-L-methionine-dependent methyltransferase [Alternaria rosae]KAH6870295.1 S-adenosyl-L-methionine-dependent methyltransferase [Alternaria rosae]